MFESPVVRLQLYSYLTFLVLQNMRQKYKFNIFKPAISVRQPNTINHTTM